MAIQATAVWRSRPSGNNLNGGGYDAGLAGAGTDYSKQNTAQASGSNATAAQSSTTFVDATANAFTSAMVGNAIWIASGTNFVVGAYFVTGFTSASTVTLDRAPATAGAGSVGVWKLGGGWADFWTNAGTLVSGNTIYVLGSGTPNPSSYTYDYTFSTTTVVVNSGGETVWANDPATPGYKAWPDTTGGMPAVKFTASIFSFTWATSDSSRFFRGFWFVAGSGIAAGTPALSVNAIGGSVNVITQGCVFDQFGFDTILTAIANTATGTNLINAWACECFNSQGGSGGTYGAFYVNSSAGGGGTYTVSFRGCNIHDCIGRGMYINTGASFVDIKLFVDQCIIAKNSASGIYVDIYDVWNIVNCTIDANGLWGIEIGPTIGYVPVLDTALSNIISNHTNVSGGGISATATLGTNNGGLLFDYNIYYNNTTNVNTSVLGPHDTVLSSNPYTGQSTENYTLA